MNQPLQLKIQAGAAEDTIPSPAPIGQLGLQQRSEVIFVEDNVGDLPTLLKGLSGEVHVLDSGKDGLQQIAAILQGRSGIDALHILSHGSSGALSLGSLTLDSNDLGAHQGQLRSIGQALKPGGDILLYGCNVGQGETGRLFIDQLAQSSGADIAASSNLTGDAAQGGDWRLEISHGQIDARPAVDPALAALYHQTLTVSTPVNFNNLGNFASQGSTTANNPDVLYNVGGSSFTQLKIDGQDREIFPNGNYIISDFNGGGLPLGESLITFSFATGQLFTAESLAVFTAYSSQSLTFTAYDLLGHQVGNTQTVQPSNIGSFNTITFTGFTNIASLKITGTDPSHYPGKIGNLWMDDFVISDIHVAAPVVASVSASTANGRYGVGQVLDITVTFSEAVNVSGTPKLLLATGGSGHSASYSSGNGTSTLTFQYTVQAGDTSSDLDYFNTSALSLNGGTIKAVSNNNRDATLTLPSPGTTGSLGANKAIVIDTTAPNPPSSLAVAPASDSGSSNSDHISNVTTPTITGTAEANSVINLYDTNGTTLLGITDTDGTGHWSVTTYTMTAGNHTLTAYARDAALNWSTVSSGLSYELDTAAPTAFTLSTTQATTTSATSGSTVATLSASDAHTVSYALATGSGGNDAQNSSFTISGSNLVAASNLSAGTYHIYLTATDAAGNATAQAVNFTVLAAPSVSSIVRAGSAASTVQHSASAVDYTVTFSESVTGVDASDFTLTHTGNASGQISAISGSGSTYTITVNNLSGDGTLRLDLNSSGTGIQNGSTVAIGGGYTSGQTYVLDHTAPSAPVSMALLTANDSGGSSSDGVTNWSNPRVTGTAEANASITLYDSDGTTVLGSTTADGSGNWGVDSGKSSDGSYTVIAKATDAAGNVSTGASLSFAIDTAAPTAVGLSASQVVLANAGSGASVETLSATDSHSITYTLSSGSGGNDADNGAFTIAGNQLVATNALTAGTYHIHVTATDLAGNSTNQALSFDVVDAPAVSSIARVGGSTVLASATSVDYTVTFTQAVTGVDASDFTLTHSGNAGGHISAVSGSGSTYTVTVDTLSGDGSLRLDLNSSGTGIQNSTPVAIVGGYTSGQTYVLDHTAPSAPAAATVLTANDSGAYGNDAITNWPDPILQGTAEPHSTVKVYDGATLLGTTTAANGSGNWSLDPGVLSEGSHQITVKATDAAGNVSAASAVTTVVIDTQANAPATPTLASASDSGSSNSDRITNVSTPTVTGTAEAGASVTLYDTDGSTVLGTATANGSGAWSITSSTLSAGSHTLTAKQTDLAGNTSSASSGLVLTLDTTAPSAPGTPALAAASDSGTPGDRITNIATPTVTGTGEANAVVKLYDTNNTLLGTATADGAGNWSITSSNLTVGQHDLTVKQTDVAGNTSVASAALSLTIESPPAPPATIIDGVPVEQVAVPLPGGGSGTQTTIPVVTSGRTDSTGEGSTADIPLALNNGSTVLSAHVPLGFGLVSSGGATGTAGNSQQSLIAAIVASTPNNAAADQAHLTGNGSNFLQLLPTSTPLLVQTVAPTTGSGQGAPSGTLVLSGTPDQHTALVVDVRNLPQDAKITLQQVDFAAIIGSASVTAGSSGQILTGDAASQQFTVSQGSNSKIFSGGGNDVLRFSATSLQAGGHAVQGAAQASTNFLHGGSGNDSAVFSGASSAYTIVQHDGYVDVSLKSLPNQHNLLINVESLQFSDTTIAVQNRAELSTINGLYQSILGRQADYQGMDFWGSLQRNGASLGQIALALVQSAEAQGGPAYRFTGDAAHDVEVLYGAVFGRHSDAAGLAYWAGKVAQGMSLAQVAQAFVSAPEMDVHKIGVPDWDFQS